MILGAAGLLLYNRQESEQAASFSAKALPAISEYVEAARETATIPALETDPQAYPREMTVVKINGQDCVGVLTIPAIQYESPVFATWSYPLLELGACRFYGSVYTDDLIVCAHNYNRLFRKITELRQGDQVWFTDMDGLTWIYEVADLETLSPYMVEELTDSGYDFTFFTCTYGGQARLTLRCVRS